MAWDKLKDLASKGIEASKDIAGKSMDAAKEKREQKKAEERELKDKIKRMDKEGVVYCPKCYSTNISANKKGVGIGKAAVGGIVAGPVGLLAGGIGKNKIEVTCLKCGNKWKAGGK